MATTKAKKAAKIAIENPNKPMGQVMREAGYSKNTAINPLNLVESKGWKELMAEYLPDEMLAERHKQFLNTEKITKVYQKGELKYEEETTDPSAVKALDMAYKLKGRYQQDINIGQALIVNVAPEIAKKYAIPPSPEPDSNRQS